MPGRDFTTVQGYSTQFLMNQNASGEFLSKDLPVGERNKMSGHDLTQWQQYKVIVTIQLII